MLMEQILERENLIQALKRVERNKGSHGVDGMPVQNLRPHLVTEWYNMKTALLQGTYQPQPVRRIEIPKPNGGVSAIGYSNRSRPFHSTSHCPNIDQDI
ncbi:retron-type reverse transcriptase [Peribacillus sp. V2I11]|nr:retron-type reverse transcriptase [Peribacillus sp. V2I11]